ncbi:glycosyltransferase [Clostridium transplantifaecale]|uniref:glycosyltransferase n=1 Tax=Clostridium transplantifaecale TaxID=2479838 RepID=UPI000F63ECC2|nr:glycosyltransferase [Clostridium transplantifaecale]
MKIGLLITSIGNFGLKGCYNSQEIGLAKALDSYFNAVYIYKLIPESNQRKDEKIDGTKNVILHSIPSKSFGINGLLNISDLDSSLDSLVYFSDTQISVPKVYRWAAKNKVQFFPYIGVLESHSTSKWKKLIMDALFRRNLEVYRHCHCLVKTPTVEQKLHQLGVDKIMVTPVGLDLSLLHQGYEVVEKTSLKEKYGFQQADKVLLFVGRLIEEKQPLRMIEIFNEIYTKDCNYRLLMVGQGELKFAVDTAIKGAALQAVVTRIEQIPNADIWELYRLADCFVNLNQQEIFGMAILEAMYYGCKVVAWKAPGPELIIEDGVSGFLVDNYKMLCSRVVSEEHHPVNGRKRVLENFTWNNMARYIDSIV